MTRKRAPGLLAIVSAVMAIAPATALAAWNQPVGGASPINQAADKDASYASLAVIDGVPYIAWSETDGVNNEIRVSRLNAAGTAWEQVVGGASPINASSTKDAFNPSLTAIGGVPYVAWRETDGVNFEIRVSRLNAAGTAWEQVVGGASPINNAPNKNARNPSLTSIGGVPYVAWREIDPNNRIRVSRLNAAGTAWEPLGAGCPGAGCVVNHDATKDAYSPSLTSIGDVPYVAWTETDGVNQEIRVSRLNAGAWKELGAGCPGAGCVSPVNQDATKDGNNPSLTAIGGTLHVAWSESDTPTTDKIRVSRLNATGTAWDQLVGGPNPINQESSRSALDPSLTGIGGAPYVAWTENDGVNYEIRVSRLNPAGTAWEQVVGGAGPINQSNDRSAFGAEETSIGGVPYVAWEETDGTNQEMRVSRLEPEFLGGIESATATTATLNATVRTFGVDYAIAFQYGVGSDLGTQTVVQSVRSGNADSVAAPQPIGGLTPATGYSWRAVGTDGARTTGAGPVRTFTTAALPPVLDVTPPVFVRAAVAPRVWALDPKGPVDVQASAAKKKKKPPVPKGTTFTYTLSEAARVVFTIERKTPGRKVGKSCSRPTRANRGKPACTRYVTFGSVARQSTAGDNRKPFSGRIGRKKKISPGDYRAALVATDGAGNHSKPKRLTFTVVKGS